MYGTRVSEDPEHREKWLVQWGPGGSKHLRWKPLPDEAELHSQDNLWKSWSEEPTASASGSTGADGGAKKEAKEEEAEPKEETEEGKETLSKRAKRHRRTWWKQHKEFRHWVDTREEAGDLEILLWEGERGLVCLFCTECVFEF